MPSPGARPNGPVARWLSTAQPEALFVLSAVAQYAGAAIAISLFDRVEPQTVAWFRIIGAAITLLVISPGWWRGWTKTQLAGVAVFGVATSLMNVLFYLGVDRIDLGKGVAIEFIGPIAVAAATTRTSRNAMALVFAAVGVVVLGGVELDTNAAGLVYIGAASAMWALYIIVGSRVAAVDRGVAGLGVGLAIGAVVLTPLGAPTAGPVLASPSILFACLLVGVLSSAIGYGIDQFTLRRIPIRRFSVLLALLPVTATVVGAIALDQFPTSLDLVGIGLVLIGVVMQDRDRLDDVEATVITEPA